MIRGIFIGLALGLSTFAWASKPFPNPPSLYVLDEPHVLSSQSLRALEALLIEHDRLTGEQFLIAIFKGLDGEDPVDWTNQLFSQWKIGRRGKDNGVLLTLFWEEHKSRIEVGYGLEPLLTDAKSKEILSEILKPELKAGHPDRALSLAALEILRTLESPLIQNGKAQQILRSGGFHGGWQPIQNTAFPGSWMVWLVLGVILFIIALNILTSAEAHFTSQGWYRPRPFQIRRRSGGIGLGGIFWGGSNSNGWWGDGSRSDGGFMGGGGSSGGGGASGDW